MTADRREALLHRAPIKEEDTHEAVACGSHPAGRPTEARSPEEPLRGCGRKAREPGSCPVPPGRREGSQGAPPGQAAAERAGGAEGRSGITDGVSTAFLAIGPRISSSAARGSAFLSPAWAKTLRVPHLAGLQGGGRPMIARRARAASPSSAACASVDPPDGSSQQPANSQAESTVGGALANVRGLLGRVPRLNVNLSMTLATPSAPSSAHS